MILRKLAGSDRNAARNGVTNAASSGNRRIPAISAGFDATSAAAAITAGVEDCEGAGWTSGGGGGVSCTGVSVDASEKQSEWIDRGSLERFDEATGAGAIVKKDPSAGDGSDGEVCGGDEDEGWTRLHSAMVQGDEGG